MLYYSVIQFVFRMALLVIHTMTLTTQPYKRSLWTKAGILPCTVGRKADAATRILFRREDHVRCQMWLKLAVVSLWGLFFLSLSCLHTCVLLCFSSLSLVHLSTPLHLMHMMGCDRRSIEMHPELRRHCFNQKHLPPPSYPILFFSFVNIRKMIIK